MTEQMPTKPPFPRLLGFLALLPQRVMYWWPRALAGLLHIIEATTIIGISWAVLYGGWWIVWGSADDLRHLRMLTLYESLSDHWKGLLVLLIPLLFRTVRALLEDMEEAPGWKRRRPTKGPLPEQTDNPPKGTS